MAIERCTVSEAYMMGDVEVDSLKAVMDVSRTRLFYCGDSSPSSDIALAGQ
jgi:hypothetical protein